MLQYNFLSLVDRLRMPLTDAPQQSVSMECLFDVTAKTSGWRFTYNGTNHTEPPECKTICDRIPTNNSADHLSLTWNGIQWSDSILIYVCQDGTAFNIRDPKLSIKIFMQCQPYPNALSAVSTDWYFDDFETGELTNEIPDCVYICTDDPPEDEALYNITWNDGYIGIGEKVEYTCAGLK
jgi:hypothetical protein